MKPRDLNIIINRLKQSAKKRGIEFSLTTLDLDEIGIPISCPILGMPLKWNNGQAEDDSYSIDRIDSSKPYTKDNIQFVSRNINYAKHSLSHEQMLEFLKMIK